MRTQTKYLQDFTLVNGDEIELEAGFAPSEHHDIIVQETDDLIVMGYIVHDDDCGNPLEDCYGVVVQTHDKAGELIESDECWGYVGGDYAMETLKEQVEGVIDQWPVEFEVKS